MSASLLRATGHRSYYRYMRRADRLFQIVHLLRNRRLLTASRLADELEVSVRTIYRDVRDLVLSGVPIEGEAGVGYTLRRGSDLPPLMFTTDEIQALVLGARIVKSFSDPGLRRAASAVLTKIETVLPDELKGELLATPLFAINFASDPAMTTAMEALRLGIREKRKLALHYVRADGQASERVIHPLGLFFWGSKWSLAAWCQLRDDFRNFRLDRIQSYELLSDPFSEKTGQTLNDFFAAMRSDG